MIIFSSWDVVAFVVRNSAILFSPKVIDRIIAEMKE
jgi:hypothetical protein